MHFVNLIDACFVQDFKDQVRDEMERSGATDELFDQMVEDRAIRYIAHYFQHISAAELATVTSLNELEVRVVEAIDVLRLDAESFERTVNHVFWSFCFGGMYPLAILIADHEPTVLDQPRLREDLYRVFPPQTSALLDSLLTRLSEPDKIL